MKAGLPIAGYVTFNVKDVPFEVFKALLTFLYTGKIDLLRPRNPAENATPAEEEKANTAKICENLDQRSTFLASWPMIFFLFYPDRTLSFPEMGSVLGRKARKPQFKVIHPTSLLFSTSS